MQLVALASVAALLATPSVYGHGRLTKPMSRDALSGAPNFKQNEPVPYGPQFVCHGYPAQAPRTTLVAGSPMTVSWTFDANHVGDCFFYLSYDTNADPSQQSWFKIAQFAECDKLNMRDQTITVPSWLKPCDHCVLRFEWYALHQVTNVEFYAQCVDVKITNPAGTGVLGTPRVRVPGHLPASNPTGSNNYRNAFGGRFYFTGPAVATPERGAGSGSGPGPVTTQAPAGTTQAPRTTTAAPAGGAPRADGRCGASFGNAACPAATCCSQFGYCGTGTDYCGAGTPPRADGRCGPANGNARCAAGTCCSPFGYCGVGSAYCAASEISDQPAGFSAAKVTVVSAVISGTLCVVAVAAVLIVKRSRSAAAVAAGGKGSDVPMLVEMETATL